MTTKQVAERLAAFCETGDFATAQKELYSDDAISIEPEETPMYAKETRGKEALLKKIEQFESGIETAYGNTVSEPLITGNVFAFVLTMDLKMKGKERMNLEELCVYEVKDGKVISEQFFM